MAAIKNLSSGECRIIFRQHILIKQLISPDIRCGIRDIFKVHQRDVRAAEEVDPELGVPLVSGVSGDDPGVQPEVGSLLREDVFGISLVDAVVQVGNEIIAEGSLKTALGEKEAE